MLQYATPFRCPECGEQTFQRDARPTSPSAFIDAECTNCGHALTPEEIEPQAPALSPNLVHAMLAKYNAAN